MSTSRTPALVFSILLVVSACGDSSTSGPNGASGGAGIDGTGGIGPSQGGSGGDNQGGTSNGGSANPEGGSSGTGSTPTVVVSVPENLVQVTACGSVPATAPDVPAGTYTIRLDASTLSKGQVDTEPKQPSVDDYVIIHVPPGASVQDHRFFMLNGLGAERSFTLDQPGTIEAFFVDSDADANHGTATLTLTPGDLKITVDAALNVIGWRTMCAAEPARQWVEAGQYSLTLESSTLSANPGSQDNYVLVRAPSEFPEDPYRYVIINGVGSSFEVNVAKGEWLRAWFITSEPAPSGQATLRIGQP